MFDRFLELEEEPYENIYAYINLIEVGFPPTPIEGVYVPMFADLKRHNMGKLLAETLDEGTEPSKLNPFFTTARLWGIADTAPYLHDGRATTLYQAIWYHGGDALDARTKFIEELNVSQQKYLLKFLRHLRTPEKPNEDLLPL